MQALSTKGGGGKVLLPFQYLKTNKEAGPVFLNVDTLAIGKDLKWNLCVEYAFIIQFTNRDSDDLAHQME